MPSYIIYVKPKPKKRPKVYRFATVNPSKKDEQEFARLFMELDNIPNEPFDQFIRLQIKYFKKPPKATPQWKLPFMERGLIRPMTIPDLDNYLKLTLDSLNGILWKDDRYIVETHMGKYFTTGEERIEIKVDEIPTAKGKAEGLELYKNGYAEKYNDDDFFLI